MVNNNSLDLIFSALADPTRRKMIQSLMNNESKRVTDLAAPFDMSLAGASKHIGILERAQLVEREKKGREIFLKLNPKPLVEVKDWLKFHEKYWSQSFEKLDQMIKNKQH